MNNLTAEVTNSPVAGPDREWLDLSLAQQSVWLDAKLTGGTVYQIGGWARVAAPLDEDAVRQAVSLIMARHDGLRLRVDDELPRQWVDSSVEPPISVVDLNIGDEKYRGDTDRAFQDHVEQVFSAEMPLGDHPLFRIELLRAGPNLNFLLWRFHHLIADSASVLITRKHWFNAYQALTSATPQELAPQSSYLATIKADASYLDSAAYHQDLAYWSSRFESLPPQLIRDMGPRANFTHEIPSAGWTMDGQEFSSFQKAAARAGSNVQRALFALCAMVLARRNGQSDVVSGVALHRRDASNRHGIGMMAGVIAVRCEFDSAWSLQKGVLEFSEQMDADLRHQRLPVDILSRALGLSGTGRAGLFEVAMSYIPFQRGESESGVEGWVTTGEVVTREASPISIHAAELPSGEGMRVHVSVNTEFLEAAEAESLCALFRSASSVFGQNPDTPILHLEPATRAESACVLEGWSGREEEYAQGRLEVLFARQAQSQPNALAVVGVDRQTLSYAELHVRSSALARRLLRRGVQSGSVVGVRLPRSTESIICLLAILKAGGIYLPLDPAYPAERLDYMAADAGALLVLDAAVLQAWNADTTEQEVPLPPLDDAHRVAYIIYTSGTTGKPKGVAVPHSAAVNLAYGRRACHDPLGSGDRVLAAISVGFDVSIGQLLFPCLC